MLQKKCANYLLQTHWARFLLHTDWASCLFFPTDRVKCLLQTILLDFCYRQIRLAVSDRLVQLSVYRQIGPAVCYRQIGPAVIDKIGSVGFNKQIGPGVCLRQDRAKWMLQTQKGGGGRGDIFFFGGGAIRFLF
jgi:hypothetical protein